MSFKHVFGILMCWLLFDCSVADDGRRLAFVVGISKYDSLLPQFQLDNPANDAKVIAETFSDLGYTVTHDVNVTSERFDELVEEFLSTIREHDTVVFFLSGHGIEIEGQNYLLPRDVPQEEYGRERKLRRRSISIAELLLDVRERSPKRTIVILDACRTHPLIPSEFQKKFPGRTKAGIRTVSAYAGVYLMYSAGAGQAALDRLSADDPIRHSVYVRHLLPLLKRRGLTIEELNKKLQDDVYAAARTMNHVQIPTDSDQLIGDFCFAICDTANMPQDRGRSATEYVSELEYWRAIRGSKVANHFLRYLNTFPFGQFSDLGWERLKALTWSGDDMDSLRLVKTLVRRLITEDEKHRDTAKKIDLLFRRGTVKEQKRELQLELRSVLLEYANKLFRRLRSDAATDIVDFSALRRVARIVELAQGQMRGPSSPKAIFDRPIAVVLPVVFDDRLELVVYFEKDIRWYTVFVERSRLQEITNVFRNSVTNRSSSRQRVIGDGRALYDVLLRPVEHALAERKIELLVFQVGDVLEGLPLAALHDGQEFLISQYSVTYGEGSFLPRARRSGERKVLLAGLSEVPWGNFPSLPGLAVEVESIRSTIVDSVTLWGDEFTEAAYQQEIATGSYDVVHIAAQGAFDEASGKSFVTGFDGPIPLVDVLQPISSIDPEHRPELLVLSGCETAASGIGRAAVRAGVPSVVASIGVVSDMATAEFMRSFYRRLEGPEESAWEAFRQSQLSLLSRDQYSHPFYWAQFALFSKWR